MPESRRLAEGIGGFRSWGHRNGPLPAPPISAVLPCRRCVPPMERLADPESAARSHRIESQTGCSRPLSRKYRTIGDVPISNFRALNPEFFGERPALSIDPEERCVWTREQATTRIEWLRLDTPWFRSIWDNSDSIRHNIPEFVRVRIRAFQSAAIAVLPNIGGTDYQFPDVSSVYSTPRVSGARRGFRDGDHGWLRPA